MHVSVSVPKNSPPKPPPIYRDRAEADEAAAATHTLLQIAHNNAQID